MAIHKPRKNNRRRYENKQFQKQQRRSEIDKQVVVKANHLPVYSLKPKNDRQAEAIESLYDKHTTQLFMTGSAGTGKTFLAIIAGLNMVSAKRFSSITLIRPNMSFRGLSLGHLPGTLEEKLEPWMAPVRDSVMAMTHNQNAFKEYCRLGIIKFQSVEHIRGRTLSDTVAIFDEAQNLEEHVLESILTRHGDNCKMVFAGDHKQSDLNVDSPLIEFAEVGAANLDFCTHLKFVASDCVRSREAREWIQLNDYHDEG